MRGSSGCRAIARHRVPVGFLEPDRTLLEGARPTLDWHLVGDELVLLADRLVLALHMAQDKSQDVRTHQFGQAPGPAPEPAALRGKGAG